MRPRPGLVTPSSRAAEVSNRHSCLSVREAGSARSRCWQIWGLAGTRFLVCRWLPSSAGSQDRAGEREREGEEELSASSLY